MKGEIDRPRRTVHGTWAGNTGQLSFLVGAGRIVTGGFATFGTLIVAWFLGLSFSSLFFLPSLLPRALSRRLSARSVRTR